MIEKIKGWLSPPVNTEDEEKNHRLTIVNAMVIGGTIFIVLVFIGNLFDPLTPFRNYILDFFIAAVFLISRYQLRKGKLNFVGAGMLTASFLLITASIASEGSIRTPTITNLALVIIISGILFDFKGILISIAASSLSVYGLIYAENAGMLQPFHYATSMLQWFTLTLSFFITGGITYFTHMITMTALKRSKKEIQVRKQVEKELQQRVAEVEKLQEELREQALHDPLTGLFNRRYLAETLPRELTRCTREKEPLSIIIADIDHFKTINDNFGHLTGDKFLVRIAGVIKQILRDSDIVCRFGGEEFLIVLPGASLDSARERAEAIRQKCANMLLQHEGQEIGITLSLGVSAARQHGTEGETIITKADQAMYYSKQMGRNQVQVWNADIVPGKK
ncbi:MAG: GGDEF domain-containing protein [Chloroflexota bacterium]